MKAVSRVWSMMKHRKLKFTPRFFALLFMLCVVFACGVYLTQESKLRDVRAEKSELNERYAELTAEEQRLEYMIEYAKSDAYKIQFAREKLGLVLPDDIKFDIEK